MTPDEQRTAAERLARVYSDHPAGIEYGEECLYSAYVLMRDLHDKATRELVDLKAELIGAHRTIAGLRKNVADHARTRMVAALSPKDTP